MRGKDMEGMFDDVENSLRISKITRNWTASPTSGAAD